MEKFKKLVFVGVVLGSLFLTTGCQDSKVAEKEMQEEDEEKKAKEEVVTKAVKPSKEVKIENGDKYIEFVQEGSFEDYPEIGVKEGFDAFFDSPKWHFKGARIGKRIVEFTGVGYDDYDEKVKVSILFNVDLKSDSFEVIGLEYNGLSQSDDEVLALLSSIFEETYEDADYVVGADELIEYAKAQYIDDLDTDIMGNILNEVYFEEPEWYTTDEMEVVFTGNYRGEIAEGEPSYLEFTLDELRNGDFGVFSLKFNGEEVSDEGYEYIMDLLYEATLVD